MKRLAHFLLNFIMILIVSICMFFIDLFIYIIKSIREICSDTVENIKYAYNDKFNQL
jgi:hypothetical protein